MQKILPCGQIDVDPELMDAVVTRVHRHNLSLPYWAAREHAYLSSDDNDRFSALDMLNHTTFRELGFADLLTRIWDEMLIDVPQRPRLRLAPARVAGQEGAELYVREHLRTVILRVRADRFEQVESLSLFLRREFLHIADMYDSDFGYRPNLVIPDDLAWMKKALAERYRILWDTVVDGRLLRWNLAPADVKPSRWRDFARTFDVLGNECRPAFEWWFIHSSPCHSVLSEFARSPLESWMRQHTLRHEPAVEVYDGTV